MKRQLSRQMFVRKLLFLVCCFFSVIWNVSKLNVLKTKLKIKLPKWIFWETIFEIWEHQCLFFYVFITEIYLTNNWRFINCRRKRTLLYSPYAKLQVWEPQLLHKVNWSQNPQHSTYQLCNRVTRRPRVVWFHSISDLKWNQIINSNISR